IYLEMKAEPARSLLISLFEPSPCLVSFSKGGTDSGHIVGRDVPSFAQLNQPLQHFMSLSRFARYRVGMTERRQADRFPFKKLTGLLKLCNSGLIHLLLLVSHPEPEACQGEACIHLDPPAVLF